MIISAANPNIGESSKSALMKFITIRIGKRIQGMVGVHRKWTKVPEKLQLYLLSAAYKSNALSNKEASF